MVYRDQAANIALYIVFLGVRHSYSPGPPVSLMIEAGLSHYAVLRYHVLLSGALHVAPMILVVPVELIFVSLAFPMTVKIRAIVVPVYIEGPVESGSISSFIPYHFFMLLNWL
jgi:hypothetical protein